MHKGYGVISKTRETVRVHRMAYQLFCGDIPKGIYVCHRCDNRICCNPTHLFLGTPAQNNLDRDTKGRHVASPGERHGQAKLTAEKVLEIRRLRSQGITYHLIASQFSISVTQARLIVTKKKWKHI